MRSLPTTPSDFEAYFTHINTKDSQSVDPNSKTNTRPDLLKTRCDKHQSRPHGKYCRSLSDE